MNPRLLEIRARKAEIRGLLTDNTKTVNLDELETELRSLDAEENELERRQQIANGINAGSIEGSPIDKPALPGTKRSFHGMSRGELIETPEYRSAFFKGLQKRQLNETEQAVMGEVRALTVAGGSVPVPTQTLDMVVEKLRQISALFPLISVHNMPGNLAIPVASTLTDAAWTAEATPSTPGDDGTVTVYLSGFTLIKTVEVSVAAYDMSINAFESYIVDEITQRMAISIENAILNATGVGQPTGILPGVTWDATNSLQTSAVGAIGYADINNLITLLGTPYQNRAAFIMTRQNFYGGIMNIVDANKRPIYTASPALDQPLSILGRPVILDDYMPANTILYGVPAFYHLNFSQQITIELDRSVGFNSGKITYRGLAVLDGKPVLSEAFTKLTVKSA